MMNYQYLFCDLDGTLVKTISGDKFPRDAADFHIRKDVLDKIRELHNANNLHFVAIVTNQGGIPQYMSEDDFLAKLQAVSKFLSQYVKVDTVADYCTSLDYFDHDRKPNTGMLEKIAESYMAKANVTMASIKAQSLMIGDASGKEGQWSDSDKLTALNFGIDYMDVDDFVEADIKNIL